MKVLWRIGKERAKGRWGAQWEHHSCVEQPDSAQQSKHTAGPPWERDCSGGATTPSLLVHSPTVPASLLADSCTQVIYFSPPHLAGRLLPITRGRGSMLTARHPARVLAPWCDTLCCWTQPTGAPLPYLPPDPIDWVVFGKWASNLWLSFWSYL